LEHRVSQRNTEKHREIRFYKFAHRCLGILLLFLTITGCHVANETQFIPNQLTINIKEPGIYQLSLTDLQAHGFTLETLDTDTLYLSSGEAAVPYTIGNNALIFYGQASTDRYTAVRTYRLETGKPGVLMEETAVAPSRSFTKTAQFSQSIELEENNIYESRARTTPGNAVWFWQKLVQGTEMSLPLPLEQVRSGAGVLTLHLWGASNHPDFNPDHTMSVSVNGRFTTALQWEGAVHFSHVIHLPPGILNPGSNTLTFHNPPLGNGSIDILYLDKITLEYDAWPSAVNNQITGLVTAGSLQLTHLPPSSHLFNISQADSPHLLTGWQTDAGVIQLQLKAPGMITAVSTPKRLQSYQLARVRHTTIKQPTAGADLIIITTDELIPALQPLVGHRTADGLRVAVVSTVEIDDAFGDGMTTPAGIDAFITYAARHWPPPQLRYVLLVGDATSDYRQYQYPHPAAYIPSPMVPVQFSGETVSDAPYADIDEDGIPDLAIGRWPVNSKPAVSTLVQRTLAYESGTAAPNSRIVIDPAEPGFARMAERLGANDSKTAVWQTNDSWLGAYIGHGSLTSWGQSELLTTNSINQPMPPILLQFTCLTGLFTHPAELSLTESMMISPQGPILTVAATSLTLSNHQERFAQNLWWQLEDTAVKRMGDAFLQAKRDLPFTENPAYQEISDTFTLFGDPAAKVKRP
jgi:hypothetical protein